MQTNDFITQATVIFSPSGDVLYDSGLKECKVSPKKKKFTHIQDIMACLESRIPGAIPENLSLNKPGVVWSGNLSDGTSVNLKTTSIELGNNECILLQITTLPSEDHYIRSYKELAKDYNTLFLALPYAAVLLSLSGKVIRANAKFYSLFGLTKKGKSLKIFKNLSQQNQYDLANLMATLLTSKKRMAQRTFQVSGGSKDLLHMEITLILLRDIQHNPKYFCLIVNDLSPLMQAYSSLEESKERYRLALASLNDGIWEWNLDSNTVYVSTRSREILGLRDDHNTISFQQFIQYFSKESKKRLKEALLDFIHHSQKDTFVQESEIPTERGMVYVKLTAKRRVGSNNIVKGVVGSITDLTSQKTYAHLLNYAAEYDNLTGLPNRVYIVKTIHQKLEEMQANPDKKIAILFFDLDRFKIVNDSLGHLAGDKLLRAVSERINTLVGKKAIGSRIGGDEFLLVVDSIKSKEHVETWAKKVLKLFKEPFHISGYEFSVTPSMGVVYVKNPKQNPQTLLQQADIAMYEAKRTGRDKYVLYDDALHEKVLLHVQIEQTIEDLLKHGGFELYFQPMISPKSGKLVSCEALIRFQDELLEGVKPFELILAAEESGQIVKIGQWIHEETCKQIKMFQARGLKDLVISINVSTLEFREVGFATRFLSVLRKNGIKPRQVEIEITETALLEHNDQTEQTLKKLRRAGIHISIDDFGTGYSSIGYLTKYPISTIKLDKSFIDPLPYNLKQCNLVSGIVHLAHNIGIKVTAEGVESKEQLAFLASLGVDKIQGYYYAKPMSAKALIDKYGKSRNSA
ncbi:MAG: EAL domain-containing protein [Candidatus Hydrogenedentota bacterium]|nr:MAG: EAL domain-containing protein [Candidatus Hydrogenedentota bacterium]